MTTPTPKADQLRALREAQFARHRPVAKPVQALRERVAAIPATKPKKAKKGFRPNKKGIGSQNRGKESP